MTLQTLVIVFEEHWTCEPLGRTTLFVAAIYRKIRLTELSLENSKGAVYVGHSSRSFSNKGLTIAM